jgi:hypothetical protein
VTLYPADLRRRAIEAAVVPLPIPEIRPPETKMYFVWLCDFLSGTIYPSKPVLVSQLVICIFFCYFIGQDKGLFFMEFSVARIRFSIRQATFTGPIPPGIGVYHDAISFISFSS